MHILFRADASVSIGSGHVVRCATLAQQLARAGHEVRFVCRELPGDLNDWLETQGFQLTRLAGQEEQAEIVDARACRDAIGEGNYDWIVVDHYGLGAAWERTMADAAAALFVIDDLGRRHDCRLLLDENYPNAAHQLYTSRVPADCELLLGPQFALVREEFAAFRSASLRRDRSEISRLLVFMGGSDPFNETTKVLNGIARAERPDVAVDVVIGGNNPHRRAVETACADLQHATLHVQTSRMAELMAAADCSVCGAGNVTWERCVLALPALVTIMAANQAATAEAVAAVGGHQLLGRHDTLIAADYARALAGLDSAGLSRMSTAAAEICDGSGAERVAHRLSTRPSRSDPCGERFMPETAPTA
jgi:UDP-2,4-diacetamido-2,4,6-trideoxy-beta-L-altropyranose hydrolase